MDSIKITSKLVSFESVTPSDNGALEYLVEILNRMGFTSEILEFGHKNKKIKNLFSFFKGGDGPNICFAGHTDVVPPGDIDAWTNKPFKAIPEIQQILDVNKHMINLPLNVSESFTNSLLIN